MKKFNIGDRVRAIGRVDFKDLTGKVGTVVCFGKSNIYEIGVEFDEFIGGHTCRQDGKPLGKEGHCWFGKNNEFEPIAPSQKIVIISDGAETLARLYEGNKVVKSATAKCSAEDTFNFDIGARLAFDRLLGEEKKEKEEPKFFSGKAVCTKSDSCFTVGKIYEFVEGQTKDNCGHTRPIGYRVDESFEVWKKNSYGTYDFIPVVE